jgi:hypothetical protein
MEAVAPQVSVFFRSDGSESSKVISQTVSLQSSICCRYSSGPVSIPQSLQATLALAHRP